MLKNAMDDLRKEESWINDMYDGLEREIGLRKLHAHNRAALATLEIQLEKLKKNRVARLEEWRLKVESLPKV
jgi:septation ring formation regulator EzrA